VILRRCISAVGGALAAALVAVAGGPAMGCGGEDSYVPLPSAVAPHDLDWRLFAARVSPAASAAGFVSEATGCAHAPVRALAARVAAALAAGSFVLLGEVHDNPHHHHVRAWVLAHATAAPAAVVLEHVRADQQAALDAARAAAREGRDAGRSAALFAALSWERSGWPDPATFAPLFDGLLALGVPILAGHPSRERLRSVARSGLAALSEEERRRLRLDEPLPERLNAALRDELEASHCGLLPPTAFAGMALAQRYRDAHMAAALATAAGERGGAVLLAGNGHVRADRGVPFDLGRLAPGKAVITVMLAETEAAKSDPEAYVPRDPDGAPAVDLLLFTPVVARKDPCVEMREQMGRRKE